MNKYFERFKIYLKLYISIILFFTFFRSVLLITEFEQASNTSLDLIFKAFIMGWRFDSVIFCYFFGLLLLIKIFSDLIFGEPKAFSLWSKFSFAIFALLMTIATIDIPFFGYHFTRLNYTFLSWTDQLDIVIPMVISEIQYIWVLIPYFLVLFILSKTFKSLNQASKNYYSRLQSLSFHIPLLILLAVLSRGRFESKSPIRIGTAFFSNNSFINQLGLNANFTLLKSTINEFKYKNNRFKTAPVPKDYKDRVLRILKRDKYSELNKEGSNPQKKNIVLIIMESMSAEHMKVFGGKENLTPFLNNLYYKGLSFKNAYTMGIHTFNGIYSTLFSYPSILTAHPMKVFPIPKVNAIPSELKKLGYSNYYFTNHDQEFDNVAGFLKANSFDEIISQKDYPPEKVTSSLGVPDDYMFDYGIEKLNNVSRKSAPFFAAFMTVSNHGPYQIPPWVKKEFSAKKMHLKTVQYADWSIEKFFNMAKNQPWYNDTLFVLVADHGAAIDKTYVSSLSYHHTPLIFFDPSKDIITKPKVSDDFVAQVDVLPSTLGLLGLKFSNKTMGMNIFNRKREFIYFNTDEKIGLIENDDFFLYINKDKYMYKFREKSKVNLYNDHKNKVLEREKDYWSLIKFTQDILKTSKKS